MRQYYKNPKQLSSSFPPCFWNWKIEPAEAYNLLFVWRGISERSKFLRMFKHFLLSWDRGLVELSGLGQDKWLLTWGVTPFSRLSNSSFMWLSCLIHINKRVVHAQDQRNTPLRESLMQMFRTFCPWVQVFPLQERSHETLTALLLQKIKFFPPSGLKFQQHRQEIFEGRV